MKTDEVSRWNKLSDLQKSKSTKASMERQARDRAENNEAYKAKKKTQRRIDLRIKHGVSLEWYDEQFLVQGGVCYICKRPPGRNSLSVDHNHSTGEIRKLLCYNCNMSLGLLKEDVNVMKSMIDYVLEHNN